MGKKIILRNIIFTFLLHLATIVNGLVVPKIFISLFGSEANGLVTSINQFLNYVTLLEGGLAGVVMASLYKPLRENNQEKISAIFNATQHFLRQIGIIYVVYSLILAVVYPLFMNTQFSYTYVLCLVLVLAVNLFVQYFFSLSYQILIKASQQVYVISLTKSVIVFLNIALVVLSSVIFPDLIFIKSVSALVLFLQPLVFYLVIKRRFKLDKRVARDEKALSQRWSGFGHTLAYFINTNISVLLLTVFASLSDVSIYSVYLMVANALRNLAVSLSAALTPSLGSVMAKDDVKESNSAFNIYEFGMGFLTSLMFACGIIMIIPFIKLYTANITDANYVQPAFAMVIMVAEMLYCFREAYINAAYAAGHIKETAKYAYIEAAVNAAVSLALVHNFGLLGIAIGYLSAVIFRLVAQAFYLKDNILQRPILKFVKTFVSLFLIPSIVVIALMQILPLDNIGSYFDWIVNAVIVFGICFVGLLGISLVAFKGELKKIIGRKKQ